MADLKRNEVSNPVNIVGGGSTNEENNAGVSGIGELSVADILNTGGLDAEITVGLTPVELKVGATKKQNRKFALFMPLSRGIKFGFSSSSQNFPVSKNQLIMLPAGELTEIWFIADDVNKKIAIGEL